MRKLLIAISIAVISSRAGAQGALSLQGLGYPPGGLSARAEATGGGVADFDPLSLVSPATIARAGSAALFLQYSPEFRRVTAGSSSAKTTTARFPLVVGVLPMGQQWTGGLSSSTFLDRSSETSLVRRQVVGADTDTVDVTERSRVLGAINDIRLALAWSGSPVFRVGVGAHVFAGSNRITFAQLFPDSAAFISTSQSGRISFAGFAGSLGLEYHPSRSIGFALAGRKGGTLKAQSGDTTVGSARIPDHYSASVIFEGIPGASILGARCARRLELARRALVVQHEGVRRLGHGRRHRSLRTPNHAACRHAPRRREVRTLPFGFNGEKVTETSFTAGFGAPLTRDRASFDFSIQRANRTAGGDVKERGLILSFGLRVSP